MNYDQFTDRCAELDLSVSDFTREANISRSAVSRWQEKTEIPPWVPSWLDGYEAKRELKLVKFAVQTLMEVTRS